MKTIGVQLGNEAHLLIILGLALIAPLPAFADVTIDENAVFVEYSLDWSQIAPGVPPNGSTHELVYDRQGGGEDVWVTGQNYDGLAKITPEGDIEYYKMPKGSGPHGLLYDSHGKLWVSLEFDGRVAQVGEDGRIVRKIDVRMKIKGRSKPINPAPHGIALGPNGHSIYFTGKRTSTVGKIDRRGSVTHYELDSLASLPIYLHAGSKRRVWGTELFANKILRVGRNGKVKEYPIPTGNSRPIAIVLGPDGHMWFSQEAGRKIARIDKMGNIGEFEVPITQDNMILAGIAFDDQGNLWTHGYIDAHDPVPAGDDYLFRFDRAILGAEDGDLSGVDVTLYRVPTRNTIMHRITQGPDGNIWFTELGKDKVGVLLLNQ